MIDISQAQELIGSEIYDPQGDKIGRVGSVYVNDETRKPEWVTVRTGMFGTKETFVPLAGAAATEQGVRVPVTKGKVKQAPQIGADGGHLSEQKGRQLYQHYGVGSGQQGEGGPDHSGQGAAGQGQRGTDTAAGQGRRAPGQHRQDRQVTGTAGTPADQTGHTTADQRHRLAVSGPQSETMADRSGPGRSEQSMTRSEEHPRVAREQVESGHVRLYKYVVTEEEQVRIPVSHEEIRIERTPVSDSRHTSGTSGAKIGEQRQEEVTLHSERPVVSKETVPVETVRLPTERVTAEQVGRGQVRKERIEVEDDGASQNGQGRQDERDTK